MPHSPYAILAEQERLRRALPIRHWLDLYTEDVEEAFHFNIPILSPLAASWPALNWTPEGLIERVGADTFITVQANRNTDPNFELNKGRHELIETMASFIEQCADVGNDIYLTASNARTNAEAVAPLWTDLGTLPFLTEGTPPFPWIGGPNTFTPLHYDLTNNLIVQVVGEKEFWIGPPSLTPRMANETGVFSDWHDIDAPRGMSEWKAWEVPTRGERVTLSPGDALFIPFGWWHQARSLSFSVTLTYTSFIWPNDMASRLV